MFYNVYDEYDTGRATFLSLFVMYSPLMWKHY
jgi:hypothetical protein